jgi:hypothetical protein
MGAPSKETRPMSIVTFEGIVENGQIRLKQGDRLPDGTKVYIVVPDLKVSGTPWIHSPRLTHPEQAANFVLEVVEEDPSAGV